jgi:SET family sugar efflux transporter-like MFS transporter
MRATVAGPSESSFPFFREVADVPLFVPLFVASVLVGFRDSMSLPYTTLFAVERAHMGPMAVGLFLTLRAAGAIAASLLFGAWFDRKPSLWPLLVALGAGAAGYAMMTTTTDFVWLCLIGTVPLGIGSAAFPLLFAAAKGFAAKTDPATATRAITLLRASFSLAWGVGPALGAVVVREDNYAALFGVSAAFSMLALLPLATSRIAAPPPVRVAPDGARLGAIVTLAAASLTLFSMAIGMGTVALPVAVIANFGGSKFDVGLAMSVCALLEVPVMVGIAAAPKFCQGFRGLAIGFVALALYFVAAGLASSSQALIWSQIPRAVGIGFVSCIGISYLQDMMPNRVGAASALYGNTGQIGGLLAGLAAGAWAEAFDYRSLFWPCAAASLLGLICLAAGRRRASA